jgi:hypothetical protein
MSNPRPRRDLILLRRLECPLLALPGGSLQSSVSSVIESAADKKCSHRVRPSMTQKRKRIQQLLAEDWQKRNKDKASHLIEHRDPIALISSPDESSF